MSKGVDRTQVPADGTDDKSKALRHPRWTRQETFILIQGKKVADNQVGRGGCPVQTLGQTSLNPSGDSISSYSFPLALVAVMEDAKNGNTMGPTVVEEVEERTRKRLAEAVFDSGRHAATEDSLFSDFEQPGKEETGESPVKETIVT
ncbi:hypothetical protein L1049_006115 [Liquidambar formosana]|uniref:Uncharacterized protein n=1 Tax=Liquidambar formosana TaxID=63359 RepID=A0AAP0WTR5_LIQFO